MKHAEFDHVDDEGRLVLNVSGEQIALNISDSLERGILSAKQIKMENEGPLSPDDSASLPISNIQNLVREGHPNSEIAAMYNIAESLVRRFAQPVETEKHYAIAQFLSVNATTSAAQRTMEDIISHNLREAGIDPKSIAWEATKSHRQPWKIVAKFTNREKDFKATWMWNLRDNSVVSIDPAAKRLLGEDASAGTLLFGEEPANASSRSIQAALNGRGPIPPSWLNEDSGRQESETGDSENTSDVSATAETSDVSASPDTPAEVPLSEAITEDAQPAAESADAESQSDQPSTPEETPKSKRRSSVPSWDDILFGE